jgi:transcriptional regulator with XRE-family HTH domain
VPNKLKHRLVLGRSIRDRRRSLNLSQEKLAEKAELSTVFVNRVEAGKENISLDATMRVARALDVQLRDLVHAI